MEGGSSKKLSSEVTKKRARWVLERAQPVCGRSIMTKKKTAGAGPTKRRGDAGRGGGAGRISPPATPSPLQRPADEGAGGASGGSGAARGVGQNFCGFFSFCGRGRGRRGGANFQKHTPYMRARHPQKRGGEGGKEGVGERGAAQHGGCATRGICAKTVFFPRCPGGGGRKSAKKTRRGIKLFVWMDWGAQRSTHTASLFFALCPPPFRPI